jgi:hypothetical protein
MQEFLIEGLRSCKDWLKMPPAAAGLGAGATYVSKVYWFKVSFDVHRQARYRAQKVADEK